MLSRTPWYGRGNAIPMTAHLLPWMMPCHVRRLSSFPAGDNVRHTALRSILHPHPQQHHRKIVTTTALGNGERCTASVDSSSLNILFVSVKWPDPNESASGARSLTLLHGLIMQSMEKRQQRQQGEKRIRQWDVRLTIVAPRKLAHDAEDRVRQLLSRMGSSHLHDGSSVNLDVKLRNVDPNEYRHHTQSGRDPLQSTVERGGQDLSITVPDVVLFDTFVAHEMYGWRVEELWQQAVRIIDTSDFHSLRTARREIVQQWMIDRTQNDLNAWSFDQNLLLRVQDAMPPPLSQIMQRELAAMYRCDLVLVISQFEHQLLTNRMHHLLPGVADNNHIMYVPFVGMRHMVQSERLHRMDETNGFGKRKHLVAIGSFRHEGNVDALKVLRYGVWPRLHKRLQGVKLDVYGSHPRKEILDLTDTKSQFIVKGMAKSIDILAEYRVLVAPLRFGAGLKGKVVDAWHNGTPIVTTCIGAEGMTKSLTTTTMLSAGEIADNVDAFVDKCEEIYSDEMIWTNKQQQCTEGLALFHGDEMRFLAESLDELLAIDPASGQRQQLEAHRQGDYIRSMLSGSVSSTNGNKYRSMYIAQKRLASTQHEQTNGRATE